MKVLLIYPPISTLERYSSAIGNAGGRQLPLGVFYLASCIRQRRYEARIFDGEALSMIAADIAARALEYRPDVVGISTTTVAFHRALEMATELKARMPAVPIVMGGPHVTACADDVMRHPEIDYAVIGEGEISFSALLDVLRDHGDPAAVRGIAFRPDASPKDSPKESKERPVVINPPMPLVMDLDTLPFPAYDLVPDFSLYNPPPCNYRKIPVANVITSRGCPNHCTFCDRSVFGAKLRQRSAANIAEEIDLLYRRHGVREIAFVDDTFTIRPQRMIDLFDLLNRRNIRFPWTCMSRVNTVDFDILRFMRDNGCWHISFGIESGSEDILRRIKKNISLDEAKRVMDWCRQLGILTKGFFIIGHPGETLDTIEQTIRVAVDMPLDDVVVTLNTPLPATEQFHEAHRYGTLMETDWSKFNLWNPVFVPTGLSEHLLREKHREFYRRFYLRPHIVWRYIRSFLSVPGIRRALALVKTLPFLFQKTE